MFWPKLPGTKLQEWIPLLIRLSGGHSFSNPVQSILSVHGHSIIFTLFEQCLSRVLYPEPHVAEQLLHAVQFVQSVMQFLQGSVEH